MKENYHWRRERKKNTRQITYLYQTCVAGLSSRTWVCTALVQYGFRKDLMQNRYCTDTVPLSRYGTWHPIEQAQLTLQVPVRMLEFSTSTGIRVL